MKINSVNIQFIGFSVSHYTLKYALITKTKKKFIVEKTGKLTFECKSALQDFKKQLNRVEAAYCFSPQKEVLRPHSIRVKNKSHLSSVIKNQVEGELLCENIYTKEWKSSKEEGVYYAIRKEELDKEKLYLDTENFNYDTCIPATISLSETATQLLPQHKNYTLLIFSEQFCRILVLSNQTLISTWSTPLNAPCYETHISKALYSLSQKYPHETKNILELGASTSQRKRLNQVQGEQGQKIESANSSSLIKHQSFLEEIGAALSLAKSQPPFTYFQPITFKFSWFYKKYRRALGITVSLVTLLLISQFSIWLSLISKQTEKNIKLHHALLTTVNDLSNKSPSRNFDPFSGISSLNTARMRLKAIQKKQAPYYLSPNTLNVSQTLSWLNTLTLSSLGKEDSFSLSFFKYKLISKPSLKQRTTPYLVKIQFSFSTSSPEAARKIHEALLKDKQILQANKPVSWSFQNGIYQTTFYLKKHTKPLLVKPCISTKKF